MIAEQHRERQIAFLLGSALKEIAPLAERYGLTREERDVFEETLSVWFSRFVARPGLERAPVSSLEAPLMAAARQYIGDFHERQVGEEPPARTSDEPKRDDREQ